MLTDDQAKELAALLYTNQIEDSRLDLLTFTRTTFKKFQVKEFHEKYYDLLNRFANQEIKNLIISMPPQVGKSEASSRRLPAFIAGIRPDTKLALVSYAATKAEKFGREIMGIMAEKEYRDIFPKVEYPTRGYPGQKANTNQSRESINSDGSMKFVGTGGPLTGDPVDVLILDDLYKDWMDGNSPIIQQNVWDWYISVAETRLHNDSQQLIVFTRWSDNDLIAKLEELGRVKEWSGDGDLDEIIASLAHNQFLKINFPAIKEDPPSKFDPRKPGEALWEEKHSIKKLISSRDADPDKFDCLHQGNPQNKEGMLYANPFKTYTRVPKLKIVKNYTDTADTGSNYLASFVYGVPLDEHDPHYYILDWLYTDKGMDVTEALTAALIKRNKVRYAHIESNNGGRGFYRNVKALVTDPTVQYDSFHQGDNKEARIFSNSATVNNCIVFPADWHIRDATLYKHVTKFKKLFKANKFDDAPDALTGIIEKETNGYQVHEAMVNADELGLL